MPEFRIGIEVGHLLPMGAPLGPELFPNLAYAVQQVAQRGQAVWMGYAGGDPLPGGEVIHSRTGAYLRSIQLVQTGAFSAEIFSELPYARIVEEGAPARDMKRMLDTSMKVRVSKSGKRYLIIPFRWGTHGAVGMGKNVMPQSTHDLWRDPASALTPSRVTGMGKRVSGTGAHDVKTRSPYLVPQRQYHWGGRLTAQMLHASGVHGQAAKRMAGMVNFKKPAGEGGGSHSQFLTFRVMVEGSSGWLAPAQPGKYPARTTADKIRPVAQKAFGKAVAADLKRAMGVS